MTIQWTYEAYCPKCHKPYVYIGDVPEKGWPKGQEPICTCDQKKTTQSPPYGWQCPVCGSVNAPWVSQCPGWHGHTTMATTNATLY